jgi:hypothetical protein
MEFHCSCHKTDHEGSKLEQSEQLGGWDPCHGVLCFLALCNEETRMTGRTLLAV